MYGNTAGRRRPAEACCTLLCAFSSSIVSATDRPPQDTRPTGRFEGQGGRSLHPRLLHVLQRGRVASQIAQGSGRGVGAAPDRYVRESSSRAGAPRDSRSVKKSGHSGWSVARVRGDVGEDSVAAGEQACAATSMKIMSSSQRALRTFIRVSLRSPRSPTCARRTR
jgi:hypothetical protein